ncbi:MAG: D-2-hydroxyacid dehydrogenase [Rikenellaceae bacterium]|nr:D-2-hydroxyacid dehydrogenase [Rikenellaceae bacterium]
MKIVFLDRASLGDASLKPIEALGELVCYDTTSPEACVARIADAEVIITNKVRIFRPEMEAAPHLKLICIAATGMNNVDLEAARERGIEVKNVAGYSTESVVQTTFAHLLTLVGRLPYFDQRVKSGEYSQGSLFTDMGRSFWELNGKRMGIIGLGTIGRRVAELSEAFGMEVVYYATSGRPHDDHFRAVSLEELLSTSDVVSIHAPLNERTAGLIAAKELQQMRPSAILLNAGRGGIVDEAALAEALNRGEIAGAGLDVYCQEPLPATSPLLRIKEPERISLTPHTAWASAEARARLVAGIAENIKSIK